MDPVSKLTRTLAVLRRGAASRTAKGSAAKGSAPRAASSRDSAANVSELHAEIARRLGNVSPEDPNRRDISVRVLLEQVLLHEFGPGLLTSQRFGDLVQRVQLTMDADPDIRAQLDRLVEEMSTR
jgi:hypothetical protein